MRNLPAILCLTFAVLLFSAGDGWSDDLRATTEDGRNVILMGDGKWKFAGDTTEDTKKCNDIKNLKGADILGADDFENMIKHGNKFAEELNKCLDDIENLENVDDLENMDDIENFPDDI